MTQAFETRVILTSDEIRRALARIAHEILERNDGIVGVVLVGMHTRGVPLAKRLAQYLKEFEGEDVPVGALDIGLYRDDISNRVRPLMRPTELPVDIETIVE